ncbi:unnamed protein product [Schistocephalus solidus]|uniref:PDZ domain-containing protein n=1 Tax=Schistocephalus solidus TaxID=70667 RepID=A0A183SJ42_SCHSO|nr:unnamed protein product [Schistocephalus solidus]
MLWYCCFVDFEKVVAPSQLHLPQHGVDTEDSGPLQNFRVRNPVLTSQLQCSVEAAELEAFQLPSFVRVIVQVFAPYSSVVKMTASYNFSLVFSLRRRGPRSLHVLLRPGVKDAVVREEKFMDCGSRYTCSGQHTLTVEKVSVSYVGDADPRALITATEKDTGQDLHRDAEQRDSSVVITKVQILLPLVEMNDGQVFAILTNLPSHLLEYCCVPPSTGARRACRLTAEWRRIPVLSRWKSVRRPEWIAGWNQKCALLHGLFHVGDQLVAVNDFPVSTLSELNTALKSRRLAYRFRWFSEKALDASIIVSVDPTEPLHRLRIRRLPNARALVACRQYAGQSLGIAFENGTNVVKAISQDGPLACTGLPMLAPAFRVGGKSPQKHGLRLLKSRIRHTDAPSFVPWTLTEINNRPLNLFYSKNEVSRSL